MISNPLAAGLSLCTVMMGPVWIQHLVAPDGGLIAMGGGGFPASQEDVDSLPPLAMHCVFVIGVTALALSALAIAASFYGDMKIKKVVAGTYLTWVAGLAVAQYAKPWTGESPELFAMPMPLFVVMAGLCAGGYAMEIKADNKSKTN
eukprot:CAMPEP_0178674142 /NCGR_PEP_ID=MMETSP0698-20121128/34711_1 /TAXON_ID=265572 /ORGANISM="Extubocellulus spinifer, Strain CCMP396" /LENGTH=146 /DNA_ID=CAMNT_0020318267 /DNA_START=54 /DNA_END=494 /DNA_ORIENTATION=-